MRLIHQLEQRVTVELTIAGLFIGLLNQGRSHWWVNSLMLTIIQTAVLMVGWASRQQSNGIGKADNVLILKGDTFIEQPIDAEYAGHQGLLGNPTGSYWPAGDSQYGTKGYHRNYDSGHVFWTAKSGAIALWHGFANTYNQTGGSNGWLGFPTKGKETDSSGGQRIDFEGGYIYWTEKEGARAFKNGELPWEKSIAAEYAGHQGLLGNPTTGYWDAADSPTGTKGYHQNYNNGHVFWTAKSGAIALWRDFADTYNQNGGSNNWLGFPTQGKRDWEGGQRIDFEGGYIYWTAQDGAKAYRPWETPNSSTVNDGQTINRKPVINFPNFEMPYGTSFSLQTYADRLQISDPDGDAIQFYEISVDPTRIDMEAWTLEGQPPGKYLIPADQFNTIKFYGSVLGSNSVLVRAFDGKEWSDSTSFNINVVASSNSGGVGITPGNGGSVSPTSPSPNPQPVSGKGVTIRTGGGDLVAEIKDLKNLILEKQKRINEIKNNTFWWVSPANLWDILQLELTVQQLEQTLQQKEVELKKLKENAFKFYPELESHKTDDNWWDNQSASVFYFDWNYDEYLQQDQKAKRFFEDIGKAKSPPITATKALEEYRNKVPQSVKDVYTKMSTAIFGTRVALTAGYASDDYYSKYVLPGWQHSGIDFDGASEIKAGIHGKVLYVENNYRSLGLGTAVAVQETIKGKETGRVWWYYHLANEKDLVKVKVGDPIIPSTPIGTPGANFKFSDGSTMGAHLHLAVATDTETISLQNDLKSSVIKGRTMSPIQAYWEAMNGISR
ncbi:MAG: hypothetical protein EAZ09_13885 [Oscillatoriales cyanobacterium]|nr:MAG: hypothetical protein EAZ09_13885 [Oscillatoriales cyanobacterium]